MKMMMMMMMIVMLTTVTVIFILCSCFMLAKLQVGLEATRVIQTCKQEGSGTV